MHEWAKWTDVSEEVQTAFDDDHPVLALESTIITHGMGYPQNLETAQLVEQAVRDEGVTPVTVAIMDGRIKVGLAHSELKRLAAEGSSAIKTSRRDIPFVLAGGGVGGTTVAATMIIAAEANIRVFATGGIGGVHRGAEDSMDVSADLEELARTDVAVVCAGPKSILDIGRTLEYLETRGVAVAGYQTGELPAFYCRESGYDVDYRVNSAEEIARAMNIKWSLGLRGGMIIANPVPAEFAMDKGRVEEIIEQAEAEAEEIGIGGKNLTPFLLQRIGELSGGESQQANVGLILNNASLGAQIARDYHSLYNTRP